MENYYQERILNFAFKQVNSSTLAQIWLGKRPFYKTVPLVYSKTESLELRNLGTTHSFFATASVEEA
jgi:hypothetical protein